MADVTAEKDKGVWVGGCPREAAEMSDCVAGAVEEVKRAVAEVVEGGELTDFERVGAIECDLTEISTAVTELPVSSRCPQGIETESTHAKSLSSSGESGFAGAPGSIACLNPGPTIKSVLGGKVDGSPM